MRPMPDETAKVDVTTCGKLKVADEAISRWSQIDLSEREREMLETLKTVTEALHKTYAVAHTLSPIYAEGPSLTEEVRRAADGDDTAEWLIAPIPGMEKHDFNGKAFSVGILLDKDEEGGGWCETRKSDDPLLWIRQDIRGAGLVEVGVHEGIHACFDGLLPDEADVDRAAKDISSFVYKLILAREPGARKSVGLSDDALPPENPPQSECVGRTREA